MAQCVEVRLPSLGRNREHRVDYFGHEQNRISVGIVPELQQGLLVEEATLLFAAVKGLDHAIEPFGRKRLKEPHQPWVLDGVALRLELRAVVAPFFRQIDTRPRASVVVKIDEPAFADGPKRPCRSVQAAWRELHAKHLSQALAPSNRRPLLRSQGLNDWLPRKRCSGDDVRGIVGSAMPRSVLLYLICWALTGCSSGGADFVFRNGGVYTVDAALTRAEAVAVDSGRIVYVGDNGGVERHVGRGTEVIDLAGKMLLPGLQDSHTHPILGAVLSSMCRLDGAATKPALLERIAACSANDSDPWLVAFGWRSSLFYPEIAPAKEELDRIVPDRPAALIAKDMHTFWLNSKALEAAGITRETPTPIGGEIVRDPESGDPSGALRDTALDLVLDDMPVPGLFATLAGLYATLRDMNRVGYTSLMDARVEDTQRAWAYRILDAVGLLDMRVSLALLFDPHAEEPQTNWFRELRQDFDGDRIDAKIVKIFVDGGTAVRSSASSPYADGTKAYEPYVPIEVLRDTVRQLDEDGFATHLHTLGDRATRIALDAVQFARASPSTTDARHAITHLVYPNPDDLGRFQQLDVTANISPWWAFHNDWSGSFPPTLGPERSRWLYPFRSLAERGVRLTAGSDYPFTPLNPFEAIEVGMTRRAPHDPEAPPLGEAQALGLEALIGAYTINAAYQLHHEDVTGSIEVGKHADLVVIDRYLFDTPTEQISETRVLMTMLEGEVLYRAP